MVMTPYYRSKLYRCDCRVPLCSCCNTPCTLTVCPYIGLLSAPRQLTGPTLARPIEPNSRATPTLAQVQSINIGPQYAIYLVPVLSRGGLHPWVILCTKTEHPPLKLYA